MPNFNEEVFVCPIAGWNLVEASAGTGKTYQVQNLFARLIMEKGWSIDAILVVTFTEAATGELRERLQKILNECVARLDEFADSAATSVVTGDPGNDQVGKIIDHAVENLQKARAADGTPLTLVEARALCRIRVRAAVLDFDNAAISTIHGFCSRMLGECAFECGADFDAELVTDKSQLLQEIVRDVWRQLVLPLKGDDAKLAADKLKFDDAVWLVSSVLNKPKAKRLPAVADVEAGVDKWRKACDEKRERVVAAHAALGDAAKTQVAEYVRLEVLRQQDADTYLAYLEGFDPKTAEGADFAPCLSLQGMLQPPSPVPQAVKDFCGACDVIKLKIAAYLEKKLTVSSKWPVAADGDEVITEALATVMRLWRDHRRELRFLFDEEVLRLHYSKTLCDDLVKQIGRLAKALGSGDDDKLKPIFGRLLKFSSGSIFKTLGKNVSFYPKGPFAEFISACSAWSKEVGNTDLWVLWLKRRIVEASSRRLELVKRSRNLMTYDDLLVRLRDALADKATGGLLKQAISTRYKIAIIDEFQDTDPVQYGVFADGFRDNGLPVFVVGDPKQAIYSFRSGDLATYFAAKEGPPAALVYELTTNWRSQPGMVEAVNELFVESKGDAAAKTVNRAFATNEMSFRRSSAGKKARSHDADKPMVVELHTLEAGDKGVGRKQAAKLTAARVAHLLRERKVKLGDSSVAVLVGTHAEARLVKEQLAVQKPLIAATLQSSGRIFESEQAQDFRFILQAMLEPGDVGAVRAALATPILEGGAGDLLVAAAGAPASDAVQKACGEFLEAHNTWKKHGLVVAFGRLAAAQGIRNRQLGYANGERRWTNLLQIAELLDRAARDQKLGMHAVARWLDRQLDGSEQDDAYEIRLESDDRAVEIMTTFKSKGLQYDYVFAPFVWAKTPSVTGFTKLLEYHKGNDLVLDLDTKGVLFEGKSKDNPARMAHEDEKLQEYLRLFYVAVTRAKLEAHLIHMEAGEEPRNALSYLLAKEEAPTAPVLSNWSAKDLKLLPGSKPHYQVIAAEEAEQRYAITAGAAPADDEDDDVGLVLTSKAFGGRIDRNWQILSFSKLAGHGGGMDAHDWDAESGEQRTEAVIAEERLRLRKQANSIFAFKAGAVTGNCWHAIFEHLDFKANAQSIREAVEKWATLYRLIGPADAADEDRATKVETLVAMVDATLDLPLPWEAERLRDVAWEDRLAEMQFHFPANQGVSRMKIAQVLAADKYGWDKRTHPAIKPVLDKWLQAPKTKESEEGEDEDERDDVGLRGFMTGFIDLTFRVGGKSGKYYLLDWKSNQLDGTYEGFTPDALVGEMAHARYFLQYLLYSAALHQYLKTNLSDYSYEDNFGGAFYVFLRGVCKPPVALWQGEEWNAVERSVYSDKPPEKLLNALWKTLSGGEA